MASKLPNYLRTYRKRAYFTQDETAFLLGTVSGTRVSRFERFGREPDLKTALAFEIIFGTPASQLFPGLTENIATGVRRRAQELVSRIDQRPLSATQRRKVAALRIIVSSDT